MRLKNLKDAVLFWHPTLDTMVNMARHPPPGWQPELTVSVVRKYFPTTCAFCPIGNLQSTDAYDHFEATTIGQTELDLKVWTTVDGKRNITFRQPALIFSLTCFLVPQILPEKVWSARSITSVRCFGGLVIRLLSDPTMNLTRKKSAVLGRSGPYYTGIE